MLSLFKYSFDNEGEEAKSYKRMSIDIDDDPDSDLLVHFPSVVRFIENALHPPSSGVVDADRSEDTASPRGVFVHCAMGISRSVTCVMAYLLYKYPHRYGGKQQVSPPSAASAAQRRQTSSDAVTKALEWVRQGRASAAPNEGFIDQLQLWWEMGCPADHDKAVEHHPVYQKWLYEIMLEESRDCNMAPDTKYIRFEDEVGQGQEATATEADKEDGKEVRCKKCRRVLATPKFVLSHGPESSNCAHIFIDTLSWMRPVLEDGALEGRLTCPNAKCGATVGRYAWQGLRCTCNEWVVPAFSLQRSRVDEVAPRHMDATRVRVPPVRNGNL